MLKTMGLYKQIKEVAYNLSVLYAEDDEFLAEQFVGFFSKFFKEVVHAKNGKEAYDLYDKREFDIVITDVEMPVMNGLDLIYKVRKKNQFQTIVTASAFDNDSALLVELLNNGIFGFIHKPLDLDKTMALLIKVCSSVQDRLALEHYLLELERLQGDALSISCRAECPMKVALNQPISEPNKPFLDDFFFVESTTAVTHKEDNSALYKDYFHQLLAEDKEELYDVLGDLDSLLLGEASSIDLSRLGSLLQRYGNTMLHYQFFSDMGGTIVEMGVKISQEGISSSISMEDLRGFIGGFCSVLQNFMKEVWDNDAQNPKFFNDSIINDATTIITTLTPAKQESANDDLVFF